jgi:hypothetical protein
MQELLPPLDQFWTGLPHTGDLLEPYNHRRIIEMKQSFSCDSTKRTYFLVLLPQPLAYSCIRNEVSPPAKKSVSPSHHHLISLSV